MNIEVLSNFITICDSGSINKAAKILHISQPPLSRQIQNLENELGTTLFDRTNFGIKLTAEGKLLYERSKSLVSMSNLIEREIKLCTHIVRFGVTTSSVKYVSNIMSTSNIPNNVSFDILEKNTFELIDCLERGTIEFAFVRTPFNVPNALRTIELSKDKIVLVGKKYYFKDAKSDILSDWLKDKPLIINRRWKDYISLSVNKVAEHPHYKFLCDDNRTAYTMAKDGLGIALVPSVEVIDQDDSLEVHTLENDFYKTSICLIYNKEASFDEITKQIIEQLVNIEL